MYGVSERAIEMATTRGASGSPLRGSPSAPDLGSLPDQREERRTSAWSRLFGIGAHAPSSYSRVPGPGSGGARRGPAAAGGAGGGGAAASLAHDVSRTPLAYFPRPASTTNLEAQSQFAESSLALLRARAVGGGRRKKGKKRARRNTFGDADQGGDVSTQLAFFKMSTPQFRPMSLPTQQGADELRAARGQSAPHAMGRLPPELTLEASPPSAASAASSQGGGRGSLLRGGDQSSPEALALVDGGGNRGALGGTGVDASSPSSGTDGSLLSSLAVRLPIAEDGSDQGDDKDGGGSGGGGGGDRRGDGGGDDEGHLSRTDKDGEGGGGGGGGDDDDDDDDDSDSGGGSTSLVLSVFNLTNTALGAGVLSLPYFFASTGIVAGLFVLVAVGLMSALSLHLLVKANPLAGANSYLEVAAAAYGKRGVRCVQFSTLLLTFGAIPVYFVIVGSLGCQAVVQLGSPHGEAPPPAPPIPLPVWNSSSGSSSSTDAIATAAASSGVATAATASASASTSTSASASSTARQKESHHHHHPRPSCASREGLPWYARREFLSASLYFVVVPLCMLKNMRFLGFVSLVSLGAVMYLVVLVVQDAALFYSQDATSVAVPLASAEAAPLSSSSSTTLSSVVMATESRWEASTFKIFDVSAQIFFALPIITLAFLNHPNLNPILETMHRPTTKRVTLLIGSSTTIAAVLYSIVGICGCELRMNGGPGHPVCHGGRF